MIWKTRLSADMSVRAVIPMTVTCVDVKEQLYQHVWYNYLIINDEIVNLSVSYQQLEEKLHNLLQPNQKHFIPMKSETL